MSEAIDKYDPIGYCTEPGKRRRHKTRAERAKRGNLRAVVELACLHCMGWDASEVPECTDPQCPLWLCSQGIKSYAAVLKARRSSEDLSPPDP